MKSAVESEGATIDEAIERGLAELGVARESVRVDILRDARRGLLGFGSQSALVRLTRRVAVSGVEELAPASAGAAESDACEAPPALPPTNDDGERASTLVAELLRRMAIDGRVTRATGSEGETVLRIETESDGLLIGKHGQTLDALEYLVNRMLAGAERAAAIALDVGGYRDRRRESLEQMARSLAARAKSRGRPETLAPMSSRDRRVIHLALREDEGVTTRSLGQGHLRRVVIAPGRGGRARADEESGSPRPPRR